MLNINLYNNGEAIREFSLNSGATDTFTGRMEKMSIRLALVLTTQSNLI